MTTEMIVADALQNEVIYFGLYGLFIVGLCMYFGYILRRWSWIPRKRQRRYFNERW